MYSLGHTFSCNIALKPSEKLITLNFLRSANLSSAYKETKLLLNYLNGSFTIVRKMSETNLQELQQIGKKYVMPLFDPKLARTAMICPSSKLKDIADELRNLGLYMKTFQLGGYVFFIGCFFCLNSLPDIRYN